MRIAIFSDTYAPEINGVARTLKRYADYLEQKGIDYKLFVPESSTAVPSVPHVQRFASIPFALYRDCRIALPNPLQLKQALDQFQPTLLHITTPFNMGLFGSIYGKKQRIPMVASYHTHFDDYLQYYHLYFLQKWIWKYMTWFHRPFEKVYVPSLSTKERLVSQKMHSTIEIWGRGVDHQFFSPQKRSKAVRERFNIKEKNLLLYVGRIAPEKEIETVLQTFAALPERIKRVTHLLIIGDGPLYKQLSEKRTAQVTWAGFIEGVQLAEIYASSDVFLFPSATETFGNVVLEAQSSGLPVVAARAGGVQHLINHGENGFLCKAKSANEFLHYTTLLLDSSSLQQTMARAARQFAITQSWQLIFENLINSYLEVLKKKQSMIA